MNKPAKLTDKTLYLGLLISVVLLALAVPLFGVGIFDAGGGTQNYSYAWSGGYAWSDCSTAINSITPSIGTLPAGN
jgi:hypothetical protein